MIIRATITDMFEEDASISSNVDEAVDMGGLRLASMSLFEAPVFLPPDPAWASAVRTTAKKQLRETMDVELLLCSYIELLHRSKALVEFWNNNVGQTADWPLSVFGESEEVEECLMQRMEKLNLVVAYVEESACS